jgi:hypothetical protein
MEPILVSRRGVREYGLVTSKVIVGVVEPPRDGAVLIEALPGHLVAGGVGTEGLMPTITTTAWWTRPSGRSMSFKMV